MLTSSGFGDISGSYEDMMFREYLDVRILGWKWMFSSSIWHHPTLLPPNAGVSDANSNFSFRTHRPFPLQVPFQFMHQQNCWTFLWALARCSLVSKFPAKCEVAEKVVRACSDARPHLVMTDLGPTWSSLPRSDSLTSSYNAPHPSASHQNVTIVPSLFPHNFSTRWVGQQNLKRCQKSQMTLFHDLFLQNHLATGVQHHFHL